MCVLELSCKLDGSMTNLNHGTVYVAHQRLITIVTSRTDTPQITEVLLFSSFPAFSAVKGQTAEN